MAAGAPTASDNASVFRLREGKWALHQTLEKSEGVVIAGQTLALTNGAIYRWDGQSYVEAQKVGGRGGALTGKGPVVMDQAHLAIGQPLENGHGAVYVYAASRQ